MRYLMSIFCSGYHCMLLGYANNINEAISHCHFIHWVTEDSMNPVSTHLQLNVIWNRKHIAFILFQLIKSHQDFKQEREKEWSEYGTMGEREDYWTGNWCLSLTLRQSDDLSVSGRHKRGSERKREKKNKRRGEEKKHSKIEEWWSNIIDVFAISDYVSWEVTYHINDKSSWYLQKPTERFIKYLPTWQKVYLEPL